MRLQSGGSQSYINNEMLVHDRSEECLEQDWSSLKNLQRDSLLPERKGGIPASLVGWEDDTVNVLRARSSKSSKAEEAFV